MSTSSSCYLRGLSSRFLHPPRRARHGSVIHARTSVAESISNTKCPSRCLYRPPCGCLIRSCDTLTRGAHSFSPTISSTARRYAYTRKQTHPLRRAGPRCLIWLHPAPLRHGGTRTHHKLQQQEDASSSPPWPEKSTLSPRRSKSRTSSATTWSISTVASHPSWSSRTADSCSTS